MIAEVEQPDGSFKSEERGDPPCGRAFCDTCGDCLACYQHDPCYGADGSEGEHRWIIYKDAP